MGVHVLGDRMGVDYVPVPPHIKMVDVEAIQYSSLSEAAELEDDLASTNPVSFSPVVASFRPSRIIKRHSNTQTVKNKRLPPRGWYGYLADGFTTIIDANWSQVILLFVTIYISSWLVFGIMWITVESVYEAFNQTCINNVNDFSSGFLYSLETQLTIGYGHRFISDNCNFGIFCLIIQSISGLLIDSFLLGLMFAKLIRPSSRRQTILFSQNAVINKQDGERYLEFRVADVRKSLLVEAHVRVTLYWYRDQPSPKGAKSTTTGKTKQEKVLKIYDMQVGYETGEDRLVLLTPVVVRHHINPASPLYSIPEEDMLQQDLEIVVALEAIVESTGLTLQALWSYTERELMFDYCFKPMVYRQVLKADRWEVDYSLMSHVLPCEKEEDNEP